MNFLPPPFFLVLLQTTPNISIDVSGGDGQIQMNLPVQMLILLTLLTFLPSIIISLSSFTRIIIVFHFLRQTLGTQEAPSNRPCCMDHPEGCLIIVFFNTGDNLDAT